MWSLINEFTLNTDAAAREAAAMEIQEIVLEEAPWVFLFQPDFVLAMRSEVEGFAWYSADRYVRYSTMYRSGW